MIQGFCFADLHKYILFSRCICDTSRCEVSSLDLVQDDCVLFCSYVWGLVKRWILTHVPVHNPHPLLEFSREDQGFLSAFNVLLV